MKPSIDFERVWMEELEGRVLLSRAGWLDLSDGPVQRTIAGDAQFKFEAKAGQRYLFVDFNGYDWLSILDSAGKKVAQAREPESYAPRVLWTAPASGVYTISLETFDEE